MARSYRRDKKGRFAAKGGGGGGGAATSSKSKPKSVRAKNAAAEKRIVDAGTSRVGSRTQTALANKFSGTSKTKKNRAAAWTEKSFSRSNLMSAKPGSRRGTIKKKK